MGVLIEAWKVGTVALGSKKAPNAYFLLGHTDYEGDGYQYRTLSCRFTVPLQTGDQRYACRCPGRLLY
jgi:hypothetical protein